MQEILSSGVIPQTTDTQRMLEIRILNATVAGGGGTGGAYTGAFADPNGNVTPDDTDSGAWYYQTPSTDPFNVWYWDVATQAWIQFSSPA